MARELTAIGEAFEKADIERLRDGLKGTGYLISPAYTDLYFDTINREVNLMVKKEKANILERPPSYPVNKDLFAEGTRSEEDAVKVGTDKRLFADFMDDEKNNVRVRKQKEEIIKESESTRIYLKQKRNKKRSK